ncbi:hypothetical protein C7974DRAFT_475743 [Boeremia exigua]|uniref:uncharacterized protein n=1 Tax=Boeremia exigua TaxID=749465 RepID=UPI001E8ED9BC|nr:uncharacterized protein C7974DRAFT_475743 [Boeremia exigua]KAH6613860.1 hypothetical protein C7974DRAFT_475743 [Boeremia exigua]
MGDAAPQSHGISSLSTEELRKRACLLEQSERASSAQGEIWLPLPTAFDAVATTTTAMKNEPPIRSVTPNNLTKNNLVSTSEDTTTREPSAPSGVQRVLLEEEAKASSSGTPSCAVCRVDFTSTSSHQRVTHFNSCWSKYRIAVANRSIHPKSAELSHPRDLQAFNTDVFDTDNGLTDSCILCNLNMDALCPADAFEHRIFCLRNLDPLPTVCMCCDLPFTINGTSWGGITIAEHIHSCSTRGRTSFTDAQAAWYKRHTARKNPLNCVSCSQSMVDFDTVEAFNHRRSCLEQLKPTHCPVCFCLLPQSTGHESWNADDILWHVRSCQHGAKLSSTDQNDFQVLEARWKGRMQIVWRMLAEDFGIGIGKRKGWTQREHRRSHRTKQALGRANDQGLYLTPSSKLRSSVMYAEEDTTRIPGNVKTVWCDLERFRRSAHAVYRMPDYSRTTENVNKNVCDKHKVQNRVSRAAPLIVNESAIQSEAWETPTSSSSSANEHDCGRSERPPQRVDRRARRVRRESPGSRHHQAVENARKAGIRIPPGFELLQPADSAREVTFFDDGKESSVDQSVTLVED